MNQKYWIGKKLKNFSFQFQILLSIWCCQFGWRPWIPQGLATLYSTQHTPRKDACRSQPNHTFHIDHSYSFQILTFFPLLNHFFVFPYMPAKWTCKKPPKIVFHCSPSSFQIDPKPSYAKAIKQGCKTVSSICLHF